MLHALVDKQFLIEELYRLKKEIPAEEQAARQVLQEIILYVTSAPTDAEKPQLPRIKGKRG